MTTRYIDVEVSIDEFSDEDIIEEAKSRGLLSPHDLNTVDVDPDEFRTLIEKMYFLRRSGRDYQDVLDQIIWYGLGRIV